MYVFRVISTKMKPESEQSNNNTIIKSIDDIPIFHWEISFQESNNIDIAAKWAWK